MAPAEEMQTAMINRSIRTIKAELEYLCDASVISPQTLNELLSRVPPQTALHAPISVGALPSALASSPQPPNSPMSNLTINTNNTNSNNPAHARSERSDHSYFQPAPSPQPPPSYNNGPPPPQAEWPPLAHATALYAYSSTDAGDLELQPHDHIVVTEHMNAEWWKGRSSRTGQEGIFPRSYVQVVEDKEKGAQPAPAASNYGNAPLDVSGMGNGEGHVPGKGEQQAKKFGKKLGNAAIFGAGATIGSNIVNSIF